MGIMENGDQSSPGHHVPCALDRRRHSCFPLSARQAQVRLWREFEVLKDTSFRLMILQHPEESPRLLGQAPRTLQIFRMIHVKL